MSTQAEIEKLKTLQESFDNLAENVNIISNKVVSLGDGSVMLNDVAEGKKQIADAINTKGGSAVADSSFQQLAEDIENLNDSFITYGVTADPKIDWLEYICQTQAIVRNGLISVERDDIEQISNSNAFYNCINLRSVSMQSLTTISGADVFRGCSSLQEVNLPELTTISGDNAFQSCVSLRYINLPNANEISSRNFLRYCSALEIVHLRNVSTFNSYDAFTACTNLKNISFGTLTSFNTNFSASLLIALRNITIGQGTNINIPFHNWSATNVIAEGQSGIDELNSNLYENLLTKLYDHSTDGQTRTLRLGWLARVTQENIDYANSKGWTLTT